MAWRSGGVWIQRCGDHVACGVNGVWVMWHVNPRTCERARARCLDSSGEWGVSFCRLLFHLVQKSLLYYFKFTVLLKSLLKSKVHPE